MVGRHKSSPFNQTTNRFEAERTTELSFEQALIEVWRQTLAENATVIELDGSRYPVRRSLRPHDPSPAWLFHPFVPLDVGQASKLREQLA